MLQEARVRLVDVETGDEPRPMRTLQDASAASEPPQPASRVPYRRAVKRSRPTPAPVAVSRDRPRLEAPTPEQPPPVSAPSPTAGPDPDAPVLGTEELLWLEDRPGHSVAEPGNGSTGTEPWRQGLRG